MASSSDEVGRRRTPAGTWSQFGNLGTVARDDKRLAARHPVEDLSPVVAQLANSYRIHGRIVSPVIRAAAVRAPSSAEGVTAVPRPGPYG